MGFTFRKRFTVIPGFLYYTQSAKSHSWTVKVWRFSRTWNSKGVRTTSVDLPGPAGYRSTTRNH